MGKLENKVAIITGAGAGQGMAMARRFVEEGAKVTITDIQEEAIQALSSELNAQYPDATIAVKLDVSNEADWQKAVEKTLATFGKINTLVNNAGMLATKPYDETEEAYFQKAIAINTWGPFVGMRTVIPEIIKAGGGAVVNNGSLASFNNAGGFNAYTASKGGIEALSRSAAATFGPKGVRVNLIQPGAINTRMLTDTVTTQEGLDAVAASIPLRRAGEPVDVANLAVFLASEESNYITAQSIIIDGGQWL